MTTNKIKNKERAFTNRHRKSILKIIGDCCIICKKQLIEIHHIKYEGLNHKDLKQYCKFLQPLCNKHHKKGRQQCLPSPGKYIHTKFTFTLPEYVTIPPQSLNST